MVIKKQIVKGRVPVDEQFPHAHTHHVLQDGEDLWDCLLNQTNLAQNNNKYYIIQLLEKDSGGDYHVWTRWGRVGATAGSANFPCGGNLAAAKSTFMKKFKEKTKNNWDDRENFVSHSGKYTLLPRDYSQHEEAAREVEKAIPPSKLDARVQSLVKLICDQRMMAQQMTEIGYDAQRMPLGKLSKDAIQAGFNALRDIEAEINGQNRRSELVTLSSRFYTLIPHAVGYQRLPPITSEEALRSKMEMLESLVDIQIATRLLKDVDTSVNPVDAQYDKLNCQLKPLERKSEDWKLVERYLSNTHGSTHDFYKLELLDVFDLEREGESKRFVPHASDSNRQLLWHGSRLSNWVGILSQGLRIAPPEAPATGYMFGKGVYFADMVSKSANYCFVSSVGSREACLLLSEVALGEMNELYQADFNASQLPAGKLSTKGVGATCPDPRSAVKTADGVLVPCGKPTKQLDDRASSLLYNEFIVYDTAQIKMRYLIKVRFDFV